MAVDDGVVWFLRTSEEELGAVRVLRLEGRVSSATAAELDRRLAHVDPDRCRGLVVDLSGLDYINGAGLRVFQTAAARLAGATCELVVCGLRPAVQTAFDLAGEIPHLSVEPDRNAAVRRLLGDG